MLASEQHTESRRVDCTIYVRRVHALRVSFFFQIVIISFRLHQGYPLKPDIKLEFTSTGRHQTRAVLHGVTTSDWLAQAQAAVEQPDSSVSDLGPKKSFNVIDEFNGWRKQPDLAKAID
ncbi:hypothetical protein YC2023_062105 [Brassica napus]